MKQKKKKTKKVKAVMINRDECIRNIGEISLRHDDEIEDLFKNLGRLINEFVKFREKNYKLLLKLAEKQNRTKSKTKKKVKKRKNKK